jgi:hypothetical protein
MVFSIGAGKAYRSTYYRRNVLVPTCCAIFIDGLVVLRTQDNLGTVLIYSVLIKLDYCKRASVELC